MSQDQNEKLIELEKKIDEITSYLKRINDQTHLIYGFLTGLSTVIHDIRRDQKGDWK